MHVVRITTVTLMTSNLLTFFIFDDYTPQDISTSLLDLPISPTLGGIPEFFMSHCYRHYRHICPIGFRQCTIGAVCIPADKL